jgi:hypothetical protein
VLEARVESMPDEMRAGALVRVAAEGRAVECFGTRHVLKATGAETGGAVGLFEGGRPL